MFLEGKIKTYNEERGFGFIEIAGDNPDVFFHIKDFPNKNLAPQIGEKLKFKKVDDGQKVKASQIVRLDFERNMNLESKVVYSKKAMIQKPSQRYSKAETSLKMRIFGILGFIIILFLSIFIYQKYQNYQLEKQQHIEHLQLEQQQIVANQRAALGDIPSVGLSEQGRKNLENLNTQTYRQNVEDISMSPTDKVSATSAYTCDGRTHCSQMRSYEEAVFFNNHCPGTKMDGNNDGIPCERQFNK